MAAPLIAAAPVRTPRVSVVIPTHNRARDLARCLDALVAQTFKDFEVLVCDDGSTDDSAAVVARYQDVLDVTYHWAENFGGPARPRNAGLRMARAAYVAFLDSDDWWAPSKLEVSVRHLDEGADLVYHDLYSVASVGQRTFWRRRRTRKLRMPAFEDLLMNGNAICNSSVVLRRELLLSIGGFSEDKSMIAWEDYDAWLRLARVTERFVRIEETLGYYWLGGGNISSPHRLISNLERFKELYSAADWNPSARALPWWYHYLMGRACSQIASHPAAVLHMRRAMSSGLPLEKRPKAVFTAALSTACRLLGHGARTR
jgi:glycosyltransferase involved in cell wall biosynthesis